MSDLPGTTPNPDTPSGGRHRTAEPAPAATRSGRRVGVIAAIVVGVLAVATTVTLVVRNSSGDEPSSSGASTTATSGTSSASSGSSVAGSSAASSSIAGGSGAGAGSDSCAVADGEFTIAVSPDIASTVAALVEALPAGGCPTAVRPADPAEVAAAVNAGTPPAEAWIPDSSAWAAKTGLAATAPSIASSPVVLAVPTGLVPAGTDLAAVLDSRLGATPIRVGLPDPADSAAGLAAVLSMQQEVAGTDDARAALIWGFRSSPADLPTTAGELIGRAVTDPGLAVPVSEQAVVAHDAQPSATPVTALPLGADGLSLDYPFVLIDPSQGAAEAAAPAVQALLGPSGRSALDAAGFRDAQGGVGGELAAAPGVAAELAGGTPLPEVNALEAAVRAVQISNEPTRLLAALDVSGSMRAQVPGANGATRVDLAKAAAARGLGLYPASSELGLWIFSTTLTPTSDHQELVPIGPLGPGADGIPGAQKLAAAIGTVQAIPDGGTGLYDTVLDGVRAVRDGWDPDRVNVLLILSDGMNDDANGISLQALISTLAAEQDPAKPVPVIAIAFGPDSDVAAMTEISEATGGATYVAQDPRDVGEIFLDAVGQRLCRPTC